MTIDLQFTPQDWERIRQDWTAWWNLELDRPMVVLDIHEPQYASFVPQFEGWRFEQDSFPIDEILLHVQNSLERTAFYGDFWPRWWPNFGAGIIAAFLGASVEVDENTVWFEPLKSPGLADIHLEYAPDNFWWRWVKSITRAGVDRWGNQVQVAISDIGGNLDILASLRGTQSLLMDLYDAPEVVDRLLAEITQLWLRYYDELYDITKTANLGCSPWATMWSPGKFYMLQSDFSYMISPAMFERFVLPDLETICNHLDYSFYHLDGKGQIPHLDMLLAIENLNGVQWIPGDGTPPSEEWLPLLKRVRDAGKLCQLYVTPEGALTVARELGGKGFTFIIIDPLSPFEVEDFLKKIFSG
jgi:5-methyltetrahydrofolate--homocysteine methyltransferase